MQINLSVEELKALVVDAAREAGAKLPVTVPDQQFADMLKGLTPQQERTGPAR